MKVRLTQQVQGTRNGQAWPEPGTEIDLPDDEAQALISGGAAADPDEVVGTVLVPPMGVHTPGRVAMPAAASTALVEAPADAVSDPAAARAAYEVAQSGEYVEGSSEHAHQKSTGAALTAEQTEKADKAAERTAAAYDTAKVGEPAKPAPAKAQPSKSDKT
jgi:hypothetical protein